MDSSELTASQNSHCGGSLSRRTERCTKVGRGGRPELTARDSIVVVPIELGELRVVTGLDVRRRLHGASHGGRRHCGANR